MNNSTFPIKAAFACGQTFLFTDDLGHVWVLGTDLLARNLGVHTPKPMTKSVRTSIRLEEGETVIQAHRTSHLFGIYTSHQRLFMARVLRPSISGDKTSRDEESLKTDIDITQASQDANCKLLSTEYVIEPGFAEPITSVTEVMFSDHTVFFYRGSTCCMYGSYLRIYDTVNSNLEVSFKPVLHQQQLVYYELTFRQSPFGSPLAGYSGSTALLSFPFTPDVIKFCDGFIYVRNGLTHHVLFPSYRGKRVPRWISFQMAGITPDCIHLRSEPLSVITPGGSLYQYDEITNSMQKIAGKDARLLEIENNKSQPIYTDKKGQLVGATYDLPRGALSGLVAASFCGRHAFLMVDIDMEGPYMMHNYILCISVRNLNWYRIMGGSVLTYSKDNEFRFYSAESVNNPHMKKVSEILGSHHYYVYSCKGYAKTQASVYAGRDTVLFHAGDRCYAYRFNRQEPGLRTKIILEIDMDHCIDYNKVTHNRPQKTNYRGFMNICGNRLDQLAHIATTYPDLTAMDIIYHKDKVCKASGDGVTRDFVYGAMEQLFELLFIPQGPLVEFNLDTIRNLSCCQQFKYGHLILMGIMLTGSHLSIHFPIALFRAIKGRELTDTELEYFAQKANPKVFNQVFPYRYDPVGIENCGYDSYRQCLQLLTNYDCQAASENELVRSTSSKMAEGMATYACFANLNLRFESMNIPTLACWFSGPYLINRKLFKTLLSGSPSLCLLMSNIIDDATEEQLRNLLQNWSGLPVIQTGILYLINTADIDGIRYEACFYTCYVGEEIINHTVKEGMDRVIDLFTAPIGSIIDHYSGSSHTLLQMPTPPPTASTVN